MEYFHPNAFFKVGKLNAKIRKTNSIGDLLGFQLLESDLESLKSNPKTLWVPLEPVAYPRGQKPFIKRQIESTKS